MNLHEHSLSVLALCRWGDHWLSMGKMRWVTCCVFNHGFNFKRAAKASAQNKLMAYTLPCVWEIIPFQSIFTDGESLSSSCHCHEFWSAVSSMIAAMSLLHTPHPRGIRTVLAPEWIGSYALSYAGFAPSHSPLASGTAWTAPRSSLVEANMNYCVRLCSLPIILVNIGLVHLVCPC
jgi:hypothetical protein